MYSILLNEYFSYNRSVGEEVLVISYVAITKLGLVCNAIAKDFCTFFPSVVVTTQVRVKLSSVSTSFVVIVH
jgi:hypothetical protein